MFRLTKDEQKIIAFVMFVLLVGLAVRYWRASHEETLVGPSQSPEQVQNKSKALNNEAR